MFGGFEKKLYLCNVNEKGVITAVQTPNPLTQGTRKQAGGGDPV